MGGDSMEWRGEEVRAGDEAGTLLMGGGPREGRGQGISRPLGGGVPS